MRILKSTTNLVANAKHKFKRFFSDVPASGGTALALSWWHPPDPKPDITSNSLMLAVEHVSSDETRDYSVISTEGGSFKLIQDNLPNFSYLLRAKEYCPEYSICPYDILASYNKWMLLKCGRLTNSPYELLWNPTTNEMRPLPFFGWPPKISTSSSWQCQSVGFDPATEDYKVVRFGFLEIYLDKPRAALFSLKTGSWKEIPYPYCYYMDSLAHTCVHINGISYWVALQAPYPQPLDDIVIVSFDFTNENFPALIPLPESKRLVSAFYPTIVEFRGSLAAIVDDGESRSHGKPVEKKPFDFEIWVWNDGWSLDSAYSVPPLDDVDDVFVRGVLGIYMNDKALLQDSKGFLLLFDCHTGVLKDLGIRNSGYGYARIYPYVQST